MSDILTIDRLHDCGLTLDDVRRWPVPEHGEVDGCAILVTRRPASRGLGPGSR
jgi:hypothetical protein